MQPGKLRHRITIQQKTTTQAASGKLSETWAAIATATRIPAEVLPDRAGEFFAARQVQATTNALIRLRYREGITAEMRVVHHIRPGLDEYYDVGGVVHFQSRYRELRLMCTKRDAEGFRRGADLSNG